MAAFASAQSRRPRGFVAAPAIPQQRATSRSCCAPGADLSTRTEPKTPVAARFRVGAPGDRLEAEADRIADAIIHAPASAAHANVRRRLGAGVSSGSPSLQRTCAACQEEQEEVRLKSRTAGQAGPLAAPAQAAVEQVLHRGGAPIPAPTRDFMETRFGMDFSGVRLHAGREASSVARSLGARAFTVGRDIVLGEGEEHFGDRRGQRLLAHELAHIVQQSSGAAATHTLQRDSGDEGPGPVANGAGPIFYRCVTQLGCESIEHCDGSACAVSACGRGSCQSALCRALGMDNLLVRAWCAYNCVDGSQAMTFYSAIGNFKIGPFCL